MSTALTTISIPSTTVQINLRDRELLILRRLSEGYTVKQTAREIGLSRTRMAAVMSALRDKCGVQTTPELLCWAVRKGVIS